MTAYIPLIILVALFWSAIAFFVLWPHERKKQLRNVGVALVVLTGVGAVSWHQCTVDQLSVDDLRSTLERDVPKGSTEEEVRSYLQGLDAFSGTFEANVFPTVTDRGIDPQTRVISATFQDVGPEWGLTQTDIEAFFLLNEDGRLTQVIVERRDVFLRSDPHETGDARVVAQVAT